MIRTTTTLALTLSMLLLSGSVLAGPKKAPPTAIDALPSSLARICLTLGDYAATVATSRDAGASLSGSLSLIRQEQAAHGMESALQALLEDVARQAYRYPTIPPRQLANVVERACVETALFRDPHQRY